MKILVVSDIEVPVLYSPLILDRFRDVDLVIGCGDISYSYQEYIHSMLNCSLCYVRGNHAAQEEICERGVLREPAGGIDLHCRVHREKDVLLAGIEGSLLYNHKPFQYSQRDMWLMVWGLVPALLWNKLRFGRYLDVFVTHAPPWKIHDKDDLPHQGIKAFRWLIDVFKPAYHLHGHIHVYRQDEATETAVENTRVINAYGYRTIEFTPK